MILVDAGPLVAIVDADDQFHNPCVRALQGIDEPMATLWPPLTEAMHILNDLPRAQDAIWNMVERGAIQLLPLNASDVPRIRELMRRYASLPMDLADASLIAVAEREGIRRFFTVDRKEFAVYRLHDKVRPDIVP